MKIIGICGSPKGKNSTTRFALEKALEAAEKLSVATQLLELKDYQFNLCHIQKLGILILQTG